MILDLTDIANSTLKYESFVFPAGEPHFKLITPLPQVGQQYDLTIRTKIKSFNDLGMLCVAKNAIDNTKQFNKVTLILSYFPAARQDRITEHGVPFTLKVYTDIINNLNFDSVFTLDLHSDVATALINNVEHTPSTDLARKAILDVINKETSQPLLISPDAGSLKKVYAVAEYIYGYQELDLSVISCTKNRNVKTGKISHFSVNSEWLGKKPCIVIDDICDGGGTFLGLAEELHAVSDGKLYLYVTHGIFSKGFDKLLEHYEHIYTTDSFIDDQDIPEEIKDRVTIIKLQP